MQGDVFQGFDHDVERVHRILAPAMNWLREKSK